MSLHLVAEESAEPAPGAAGGDRDFDPGNDHVDLLGCLAMDRIQLVKDSAQDRRFEWSAKLD